MKRLAVYERGEALWLNGLAYDAEDGDSALGSDTSPPSTWGASDGSASAEEQLLTVVRWWDVHRASDRVVREKRDRMMMRMRAAGYSEEEIAEAIGLTRSTTRRRIKTKLRELLEELGGEVEPPPERKDHVDACLVRGCGRPRARLAAVVAEPWTLIGARRDGEGRVAQGWLDGDGTQQLFRRPLTTSAPIGAVYEVTVTRGLILAKPVPLPDDRWLAANNLRVRAWRVDEQRAQRGEPVPERSAAPQRGRVVLPERHASVCALCLAPEHRPRLLPPPRDRQPTPLRRAYGSSRGARTATSSC